MRDIDWINRLGKWRTVFTGRQLGTRAKGDPEGDAVRDHFELSHMMRAELNAIVTLLVERKVFTVDEFRAQLHEECRYLCELYERRFPGFKASDEGMVINPHIARDTTAGWKP